MIIEIIIGSNRALSIQNEFLWIQNKRVEESLTDSVTEGEPTVKHSSSQGRYLLHQQQ